MNRRDLLAGSISAGLLAGGVSGWLRDARAQQQNVPAIGLFGGTWGHLNGAVGGGLRENGIKDGKFEYSGWTGKRSDYQADQMAKYAAELVKRQVALILAFSTRAALAAKAVTNTTPIIFLADEPVAAGLVDSLDRPGGNLTGAASPVSGLIAKRIEIVRELVPATNSVVLVTDPTNKPAHDIEIREAQLQPKRLGFNYRSLRGRVSMISRSSLQRSRATARPCWSLAGACRSLFMALSSTTWLRVMNFLPYTDAGKP